MKTIIIRMYNIKDHMMRYSLFFLICINLIWSSFSYEYLLFPKDARSIALSNSASAYNRTVLLNNPAALSKTVEKKVYSFILLPADIQSGEFQVITEKFKGVLANKLSILNYGTIVDSETKNPTSAYDVLIASGYKKEVFDIISIGFSSTFMHSSIAGFNSNILLCNIGMRGQLLNNNAGLGVSVENVPFIISSYANIKERISKNIRWSIFYSPKYIPLVINTDFLLSNISNNIEIYNGLEFIFSDILTLRFGISNSGKYSIKETSYSNFLESASFGAGFSFTKYNLDIGFMNLGPAGYITGLTIKNKLN